MCKRNLDYLTIPVLEGYTLEKKLNEGAFGQVFRGKDTKNGEPVAIKVMFCEKLGAKYQEKFWPRELAALRDIRHPHVVEIFDIIRASGKLFVSQRKNCIFSDLTITFGNLYLDIHGIRQWRRHLRLPERKRRHE